jgi:hypothetical protein
MRRLRPFRRRSRQRDSDEAPSPDYLVDEEDEAASFQPFVPVSGAYQYQDDEAESESAYVSPSEPRRRIRLPRLRVRLPRLSLGLDIRFGLLLLALLLIAAGVFGTLLNLDRLHGDMTTWWPLGIIVVASLWLVVGLLQRQAAVVLGSSAGIGIGLSLLMHTQDIATLNETLVGVVLVTAGLGIVIRGLLIRQQTPA